MLPHLLRLAASVAISPNPDHRNHRLGAVGVRSDGIIVSARNGAQKVNNHYYRMCRQIHAEVRCLRKMDMGGVIYVARVVSTGLALARPCLTCQQILRGKRIKKVVYSISDLEYGTLYL